MFGVFFLLHEKENYWNIEVLGIKIPMCRSGDSGIHGIQKRTVCYPCIFFLVFFQMDWRKLLWEALEGVGCVSIVRENSLVSGCCLQHLLLRVVKGDPAEMDSEVKPENIFRSRVRSLGRTCWWIRSRVSARRISKFWVLILLCAGFCVLRAFIKPSPVFTLWWGWPWEGVAPAVL